MKLLWINVKKDTHGLYSETTNGLRESYRYVSKSRAVPYLWVRRSYILKYQFSQNWLIGLIQPQ